MRDCPCILIRVRQPLLGESNFNETQSLVYFEFFFKWLFPFSHMQRLYESGFIFGEAISLDFFRATTSIQQLLFQSSCFFRTFIFGVAILSNRRFFSLVIFYRIASFSKWNSYCEATSSEKRISSSLVVLQVSYFLRRRKFLEQRYLQVCYLFRADTPTQHQCFQARCLINKATSSR